MNEQASRHTLLDFVNVDTTQAEFKKQVGELVKDTKQLSLDTVSEGLLFMSGFAPSPASFDSSDIKDMILVGTQQETDTFIEIAKSLRVLKDSESDGKYEISEKNAQILRAIVESGE